MAETVKGLREFNVSVDGLVARFEQTSKAALSAAAKILIGEARSSFGSGSGSPESRTGRLAGSIIATEPVSKGLKGYQLQVGPTGVEYARKVELGKRGHRSAPPHPYLAPGYKRAGAAWALVFREMYSHVKAG